MTSHYSSSIVNMQFSTFTLFFAIFFTFIVSSVAAEPRITICRGTNHGGGCKGISFRRGEPDCKNVGRDWWKRTKSYRVEGGCCTFYSNLQCFDSDRLQLTTTGDNMDVGNEGIISVRCVEGGC
ncbi:hypothetical protein BZA77DRAFT_304400 [Pyronema omphalodes]|nr:hypothetical protein BZA77DRAFT_304400 [Pyronema omphalodes]